MRWIFFPVCSERLILYFILILWTNLVVTSQNSGDPYKILGLNRHATLSEIRKAYKLLAKEWHPDKNEDPSAESRFVEIKQAYELLSDSDRRNAFDMHGITNEDNTLYREKHDYSQYGRFSPDPFEQFFGFHGGFKYHAEDITLFHKFSITSRHFENNLTEKSVHTPALVLFYTDWCTECMAAAPVWRRLVQLRSLGLEAVTVHAAHEPRLTRRISAVHLPVLCLLLDRQLYIYRDGPLTMHNVIDFIRQKLPYKLITPITDDNVDSFLSDFEDNKVRGLIFEDRSLLRLRYLLTAFYYRDRVKFGFVDLTLSQTRKVKLRYNVEKGIDTVMLFKEDYLKPVASISMAEIPTHTLHQVISANEFLTLPRLSSQKVMELVCPVEYRTPARRLCGILVVDRGNRANMAKTLTQMRQFVASSSYPAERVRYAYIYSDKQSKFLSELAAAAGDFDAASDPSKTTHRIIIIWRKDFSRIQYEWLNETWPICEVDADCNQIARNLDIGNYFSKLNDTVRLLDQTMHRLLRPGESLSYETTVQDLVDELAVGALWKFAGAAIAWIEKTSSSFQFQDLLPVVSLLATVAVVLVIGYIMARAARLEEEEIEKKRAKKHSEYECSQNNNENISSTVFTSSELRLHELRAEKFNGLVRLLKPGCRTLVILVDMQSRVQLLSAFHKIVWPYRKNKTLMFAHLLLERNLNWYKKLLQLSLPEPRELNINPRNCVGTVLSLNGHRKYFCMFHAKHPESSKGSKRLSKMTRSLANADSADPEAGAFIGFESEDDSSDNESVSGKNIPILQENLLDGLSNWLDRLFEGTTHRYYINYWPDIGMK